MPFVKKMEPFWEDHHVHFQEAVEYPEIAKFLAPKGGWPTDTWSIDTLREMTTKVSKWDKDELIQFAIDMFNVRGVTGYFLASCFQNKFKSQVYWDQVNHKLTPIEELKDSELTAILETLGMHGNDIWWPGGPRGGPLALVVPQPPLAEWQIELRTRITNLITQRPNWQELRILAAEWDAVVLPEPVNIPGPQVEEPDALEDDGELAQPIANDFSSLMSFFFGGIAPSQNEDDDI
jgi:hypothetical protein